MVLTAHLTQLIGHFGHMTQPTVPQLTEGQWLVKQVNGQFTKR